MPSTESRPDKQVVQDGPPATKPTTQPVTYQSCTAANRPDPSQTKQLLLPCCCLPSSRAVPLERSKYLTWSNPHASRASKTSLAGRGCVSCCNIQRPPFSIFRRRVLPVRFYRLPTASSRPSRCMHTRRSTATSISTIPRHAAVRLAIAPNCATWPGARSTRPTLPTEPHRIP